VFTVCCSYHWPWHAKYDESTR